MRSQKVEFILFLIPVICLLFAFSIKDGLTPQQERGKLIYTKGLSASTIPIKAKLSEAEFDAKILPCINCHGMKGEGNPEGGVIPSNVTWPVLTKSYSLKFDNGRRRIGYDEVSLGKAILHGIDASGNTLDMVMPRYALNEGDLADLIAYLKVFNNQNEVGVSNSFIKVGVILPEHHPAGRSEAMMKAILSYVDLVNTGGGLFNRKIEIIPLFVKPNAIAIESQVHSYLQDHSIFCFIASDLEVLSPAALTVIRDADIPIIGAVSGNPRKNDYINSDFYYLFPGSDLEIQALFEFAIKKLSPSGNKLMIIIDESSPINQEDLASFASNEAIQIANCFDGKLSQNQVDKMKEDGISNCLLLGNAQNCVRFMKLAEDSEWFPNVLISGKLASADWLNMSEKMNGKIYFSYPTWTSERDPKAMHQYELMAEAYHLDRAFENAQLNVLASTILFTELLKLTGKELSKSAMIETLQGFDHFQTGFVSPQTFGPNKRIGSEKVFILQADLINKQLLPTN